MRHLIPVIVVALLASAAPIHAADVQPKTDEEKTIYTLGLLLSRNLAPFALTEKELEFVQEGLADGVLNRPKKAEAQTYGPKIQELQKSRAAALAETEKKSSAAFLEKAAAEKGAKKTASGLIISEITPGTGPSPKATDKVKVHYTGTLIDGTVFDSSVKRGQPATFPLNGVIPCWTEGVQLMKVGGKSKLICPSSIAYGDRGQPPLIKPGATLIFEVELLEILPPAGTSPPAHAAPSPAH